MFIQLICFRVWCSLILFKDESQTDQTCNEDECQSDTRRTCVALIQIFELLVHFSLQQSELN